MKASYTILIVDDSRAIVHYLIDILNKKTHNLLFTYSEEEAKKIIQQNEIDLLICDLMLPSRENGLATIRFFRQNNINSKVLVISAYPDLENVVSAMKAGADDFIPKTSVKEQIIKKIENLKSALINKNDNFVEEKSRHKEDVIIGKSSAIREALKKTRIIAQNEIDAILITGESGTGKELFAKMIHKMSPRESKPFIAVNCAGIPDTLIDSELFGFEKGSFTGAYQTSIGKFELANRGVLFLDEISEMPTRLQAKLLRVLENREVLRIGRKNYIPIDVMIIASTNQDLEERISKNLFRADIYFRLNTVKIEILPLRERKQDIPLLVEYFLKKVSTKFGRHVEVTDNALVKLQKYDFPGNVRELKNIIYSAALFCNKNIIRERNLDNYLNTSWGIKTIMFSNDQKQKFGHHKVDEETLIKELEKKRIILTNENAENGKC